MFQFGEKITGLYIKKIFELIKLLSKFPEIGTLENKEKSIRGFVIIKQLTIFYKIKKDKIIILDFFDNRQSPDKKSF